MKKRQQEVFDPPQFAMVQITDGGESPGTVPEGKKVLKVRFLGVEETSVGNILFGGKYDSSQMQSKIAQADYRSSRAGCISRRQSMC
jgi:hypothetical protein